MITAIGTAIFKRKSQGLTLVGSSTAMVMDAQGDSPGDGLHRCGAVPHRRGRDLSPGAWRWVRRHRTRCQRGARQGSAVHVGGRDHRLRRDAESFDLPAVILGAVVGPSGGRALEIETLQVGPVGGDMTGVNVGVPWNRQATIAVADVNITPASSVGRR